MHPMAFAAWFGLLATALNLFPIGQLDGGHISYAVLGRRSTYVTLRDHRRRRRSGLTVRSSWIVWTMLMIVDADRRSARTIRGRSTRTCRSIRAGCCWRSFALVMFVVCFTPAPIEPHRELVRLTSRTRSRSDSNSDFRARSADRRRPSSAAQVGTARRAPPAALRASAGGWLPFRRNCARYSPRRRAERRRRRAEHAEARAARRPLRAAAARRPPHRPSRPRTSAPRTTALISATSGG